MLIDSVPCLPLSAGAPLSLTSPRRFGCVTMYPTGPPPSLHMAFPILNGIVRVSPGTDVPACGTGNKFSLKKKKWEEIKAAHSCVRDGKVKKERQGN